MGILTRFSQAQQKKIKFIDLPVDLQQYIIDMTTDSEREEYDDLVFDVFQVSLDSLPEFTEEQSYRKDWEHSTGPYVADMVKATDLPPIIYENGEMVDGMHRVMAARQRGDLQIDAIDISFV